VHSISSISVHSWYVFNPSNDLFDGVANLLIIYDCRHTWTDSRPRCQISGPLQGRKGVQLVVKLPRHHFLTFSRYVQICLNCIIKHVTYEREGADVLKTLQNYYNLHKTSIFVTKVHIALALKLPSKEWWQINATNHYVNLKNLKRMDQYFYISDTYRDLHRRNFCKSLFVSR